MEKLITPKKAAELLSVTTDCLRKWERAKKITAVKTIGGHRRYKLEEIIKTKTM
jgi:excisionase family DNA binding protein